MTRIARTLGGSIIASLILAGCATLTPESVTEQIEAASPAISSLSTRASAVADLSELATTATGKVSETQGRNGLPFAWTVVAMRAYDCLLYTSPSPRDQRGSRMPSSA